MIHGDSGRTSLQGDLMHALKAGSRLYKGSHDNYNTGGEKGEEEV